MVAAVARHEDLRTANTAAKPILREFDAILAKAAALLSPIPTRDDLSEREIAAVADFYYASMLTEDEEVRRYGTGSEQVYRDVAKQLADLGIKRRQCSRPSRCHPSE